MTETMNHDELFYLGVFFLIVVVFVNGLSVHLLLAAIERLRAKITRLEVNYESLLDRYWQLSDILVAHMGKDE